MSLIVKTVLAWFAFALIAGGAAFGSTFTSASCSVTIGSQTTIQTNSEECALVNFNGNYLVTGYTYAAVSDSDSSASVYALVETNAFTHSSNVQVNAATEAVIHQDFSSSGPMRMGTITFNAGCYGEYNHGQGITIGCRGLRYTDGGMTTALNIFCDKALGCESVTLPVELGSVFSIDSDVDYSTSNTYDVTTGLELFDSFTLNELDGKTINVVAVPEPSTLPMLGLATAMLTAAFWRRRTVAFIGD